MFKTNESEFGSAPERNHTDRPSEPQRASSPEFETLDAFADWLDEQLVALEESHDGFETASSVRGFFGR